MLKRKVNICLCETLHTNVHKALFLTAKMQKHPNAHQLMEKQNVTDTYHGVLFSHKKEWHIGHVLEHRLSLDNAMLSERSQSQKTTNYTNPFI